MKNFQTVFNKLKNERNLTNKQIASFTGAKIKEVKQWESGVSFPTDSKTVNALEGLLGTEIVNSLKAFQNENNASKSSLATTDDSLFRVEPSSLEIKETSFDKFRGTFQRKSAKPKTYNEDESYGAELTNHTVTQDQKAESSLLVETDESPYILDQNQLSFYFSRNVKTVLAIGLLLLVSVNFASLLWDSLIQVIENLT
jgi:transcriptional regulator with XRE-family HTH domain